MFPRDLLEHLQRPREPLAPRGQEAAAEETGWCRAPAGANPAAANVPLPLVLLAWHPPDPLQALLDLFQHLLRQPGKTKHGLDYKRFVQQPSPSVSWLIPHLSAFFKPESPPLPPQLQTLWPHVSFPSLCTCSGYSRAESPAVGALPTGCDEAVTPKLTTVAAGCFEVLGNFLSVD